MSAQNPLQRFDIEPEEIDRLMVAFYARIQAHDVLGPIFFRAVGEDGPAWRAHEAKIASFWRNAILMDRDYTGNPMQVHRRNGEVRVEHFALWLDLFHTTAKDVLNPEKAANIAALADRIGRGLAYGIETAEQKAGVPPNLRS